MCPAVVRWVETPDGRRVPLDVLPDARGNYLVDAGGQKAKLVGGAEREKLLAMGARLFLDHHVTCRAASRVRAGELKGQGTLF